MRHWVTDTNRQLALVIWCAGLFCAVLIARGPHGFAGMTQSVQGILLLVFMAGSGPIGWGLVKRLPLAKWGLAVLLVCQAALSIRAMTVHPTPRSAIAALVGCWIIHDLIRWDITGRIEADRRTLARRKYVKHKSPASSTDDASSLKAANLIMDRFCGREIYPVQHAEWHFYDRHDDMPRTFHLRVEAGFGTTLHEDTTSLQRAPFWTVGVIDPQFTIASLVPGTCFDIPHGYDESRQNHQTNFFYVTHEVSDQNKIEILVVEGDRFLIRLQGQIADVNYGPSQPPSRISVEAWFVEGD